MVTGIQENKIYRPSANDTQLSKPTIHDDKDAQHFYSCSSRFLDLWDQFKRISNALSVAHALNVQDNVVSLAQEFYG